MPPQVLLDELINCRNRSLSAADAVIIIVDGPPVTVNVYQPSCLNVLNEQPYDVGPFSVVSVIEALSQGPFITKVSADPQVVPCANVVVVKAKKAITNKVTLTRWV